MSRSVRLLIAAAALLAVAACGSNRGPLITIDAQGSITLNGEPATLANLAELPALQDPETPVRIRVSPEAAYLHVDSLQKVLQRLHVKRIVFER
ncbi:MAG: hypothetical protein PVH00_08430 [Gemmatimonadota bacterium]|jgi:biopolymer transport protein ExbD